MSMPDRLVYLDDDFDELVAEGADVHVERMDDHSIFVCVSRGDAELFRGFIGASGRCKVRVFSEESECAIPRRVVPSARLTRPAGAEEVSEHG